MATISIQAPAAAGHRRRAAAARVCDPAAGGVGAPADQLSSCSSSISAACCGRCGSPSRARRCCRGSTGSARAVRPTLRQRPLHHLGREHRHLRRAVHLGLPDHRLSPRRLHRPERPRRRALPHALSLPYAMSFVVTGVAWQWFLNPALGLQKLVRDLGFPSFTFDWIVSQDDGDLHHRHRRALAWLRPDHGDPACRACAASTRIFGRPPASTASRPGGFITFRRPAAAAAR